MRRPVLLTLLLVGSLAPGALLAGCGGEGEKLDVVEGEPLELEALRYNVQITRFLNRSDSEDRAYLQGEPPPPPEKAYLGVFMTVENESDNAQRLPSTMTIRDTRDDTYEPVRGKGSYALALGSTIPAEEELPESGTPAATGPIKGAMVLFLVDQGVTENRPIELEIPGPGGETGRVELDI